MASSEPPTMALQSDFNQLDLQHTLEDLSARFIVNLPAEELESMDRVCFQIEQAHWYYEDFVRPQAAPKQLLPSFNLKRFSLSMFEACPLLHDLIPQHEAIWTSFMAYKERVPVCGAILISEYWDKVLLVKGWKGSNWSFPRGKINKEESEASCAAREVLEETGFDMSSYFPEEQLRYGFSDEDLGIRDPYYVELVIKEQKIRLYFIPGVHEDTYFETRTRKEISKIDWFNVSDLPTWRKHRKDKKAGAQARAAKFYMVTPFISHLALWIDANKPKRLRKRTATVRANSGPHASTAVTGLLETNEQTVDSEDFESTSSPSTDDDLVDEGVRRPTQFQTREEGTEALQAFFFGGEPNLATPTPPPIVFDSTLDTDLDSELDAPEHPLSILFRKKTASGQTPPQLAYQRQTSFVQPTPKATSDQKDKLLALLQNPNPVASPPPPKKPSRRSSRLKEGEATTPTATREPQQDLLSSLDQILAATSAAQLRASASAEPSAPTSRSSSPGGHSVLFADSAPPQEAEGFGITHVLSEAERTEEERQEKHDALLRALLSLSDRPPPREPETPFPHNSVDDLFARASRSSNDDFVVSPPPFDYSSPILSPPHRDRQGWQPTGSPQADVAYQNPSGHHPQHMTPFHPPPQQSSPFGVGPPPPYQPDLQFGRPPCPMQHPPLPGAYPISPAPPQHLHHLPTFQPNPYAPPAQPGQGFHRQPEIWPPYPPPFPPQIPQQHGGGRALPVPPQFQQAHMAPPAPVPATSALSPASDGDLMAKRSSQLLSLLNGR